MKKTDNQNDILLSLSYEFVRVRGKEDMLDIILNKLKKHIDFDDSFIVRYNKNTRSCRPFIYYSEVARSEDPEYKASLDLEYPVADDSVEEINFPQVYDVATLLPLGIAKIDFMHRSGIKEFAVVKLIEGNELKGLFILLSEKSNSFKDTDLDLLHRLSYQISMATANIIANEEIAKTEQEKEILLSLSQKISSLRSKDDLLSVLTNKLKELFPVTGIEIRLINKDSNTHNQFIADPDQGLKNDSSPKKISNKSYSVIDPFFIRVINAAEPSIFIVDELAALPGAPEYIIAWKESGIHRVLGMPLLVGQKKLGCLIFHLSNAFKNDISTDLVKGVSSQIAVRISNIMANEEIQRREEEKCKLLSFSNAMASVSDKIVIAKILKEHLSDFFSVEDYIIYVLSKDKKTFSPFLFDPNAGFAKHQSFQESLNKSYDIKDTIFSQISKSESAVLISTEKLLSLTDTPHYATTIKKAGIKKIVSVPIRLGHENIAFLNFRYNQTTESSIQQSLFKSICSQLAIAVSNIIAYEEIAQREAEKAMLLALCSDIAKIRNKNDLRIVTDEKLKTLLDVNNISFCYISPDGKTFGSFILDPKSPSTKHPEYGDITSAMHPVNDGIINKVLASEVPLVYDMESYIKTSNKVPDYFKMIYDVGMRQMIFSRLKNGEDIIGYLAITKKVKTHIEKNQINLIKAIAAQLSVALANIKANEQIEDQVKEINNFKNQLEKENLYLQEEINSGFNKSEIIGESGEMEKIFHMVSQVATSDSTVLLLGETGTGKELIARAIHNASPRSNKLMVKVNCATLPANLIESELFGHERGSFTGATEQRIGKFELANNGTLFLDEIGEMPLELQVKLLRVLQEKEIERIGGKATIHVDVRIISATNGDLEKLMEEGKFRSDLYYRLNIFPINLPPLRNRREDIPSLARHFIERFSKKMRKQITGLSDNVLNQLRQYNWPGNIRELEHLIERSVLLSDTDTIKEILLPRQKNTLTSVYEDDEFSIKTIDEKEREYILKVIKHVNGKIAGVGGAAALLGVPPSTLTSKMKRLGIRKEHIS